MKVIKTKLDGILILEPQVFGDERGFFLESHNEIRYSEIGINEKFVQDNISKSTRNVLRGLHYQVPPYAQGKLVQVIGGRVLDVAVDIRFGSPTYGEYVIVELSGENKKQLWIPPGFAHGFLAISDEAIFHYKCTASYHKESERIIAWNDPELNIRWGVENPSVSGKDILGLKFKDIVNNFTYIQKKQEIVTKISRKVLVTGGAGFIGSNFIKYWLKKYPEDKVVNLDALTYAGNLDNLESEKDNPNYRFVKGNILDEKLVDMLVKQVDLIVHFAAESHVDRSINDSGSFMKTNVEGTRVLLEAARRNGGVRFHHISTDEVFGHLSLEDEPFNENSNYAPRSPYSASKAASDHLVRSYHSTYNLPITISNCSNNYGPFQFPEKLHALLITNLIRGEKMPLYGDGKQIRDWLFVEDHCRAIDLIISKGKIGETYLVGGECEKTNLEIAQTITQLLFAAHLQVLDKALLRDTLLNNNDGKDVQSLKNILELIGKTDVMVVYVKDRPGHDRRYAINISKISKELGWKPLIGFEDGMKRTVEWYQHNQDWWKKIKSGEYQQYYEDQYGAK
ncbi:dTDP-glucose 4,6-dehydratase [Patescibacteria group bacterium]|nr:dTDP-glucose 4,6-dehydratase [Patescibacteria group bacterium]